MLVDYRLFRGAWESSLPDADGTTTATAHAQANSQGKDRRPSPPA